MQRRSSRRTPPATKSAEGAPEAPPPLPATLQPMQATSVAEPFDSPEYIYELLWGGIRALAFVEGGAVRFQGRDGRDLTPLFPELSRFARQVRADSALFDGEIVAWDGAGSPNFELFRPRLWALLAGRRELAPLSVSYQAFDLLYRDGRALTRQPLLARKEALHGVLTPGAAGQAVDFIERDGAAFFQVVLEQRLEGLVAKHRAGQYLPGRRSASWLEVRAVHAGDFVIGGYTFGGGRRRKEPFASLLLGSFIEGGFRYVGAVSGGLSDAEAQELLAALTPLHVRDCPFERPPAVSRFLYWCRPQLVCRVRFSEWSRQGLLRFPVLVSLRPDLSAEGCGEGPAKPLPSPG